MGEVTVLSVIMGKHSHRHNKRTPYFIRIHSTVTDNFNGRAIQKEVRVGVWRNKELTQFLTDTCIGLTYYYLHAKSGYNSSSCVGGNSQNILILKLEVR